MFIPYLADIFARYGMNISGENVFYWNPDSIYQSLPWLHVIYRNFEDLLIYYFFIFLWYKLGICEYCVFVAWKFPILCIEIPIFVEANTPIGYAYYNDTQHAALLNSLSLNIYM